MGVYDEFCVSDLCVLFTGRHVCRLLNSWTEKLLQKRIESCVQRLATILAIESSVLSCSLDGDCTFVVSAMVDPKDVRVSREIRDQVTNALLNQNGDISQVTSNLVSSVMEMQADVRVDKEATISIPALTWTDTTEAEDLQVRDDQCFFLSRFIG